ncbi:alanine/glycine:cation symporter family protein [Gleimia hominis]|uniref:Alanine/glycine:cation symporter family protein n=1 Tax=Gleimia hominis TaxID=595468 RepID=A0ABU3IFE7_9ACTO|nr:alanine/glycine:cation symporter family protein [Gleimia hominis]MDT3767960.1 alanine/glycine:cation symporter family protein [Gleimia hominis]
MHSAIYALSAAESVGAVADWITLHITMWVLFGAGVFFTVITRFVQVRHLPRMVRTVLHSRGDAHGGISSFQAFTISLAARVGIGNVFGVAAALMFGGPGALVWMWGVALVGMATAFFEATLAQVFKVRGPDGSFRGGPAYYMRLGMHSRALGVVFAIITIVTCGFVITSVQANAIAQTVVETTALSETQIAIIMVVCAAPVIFGGVRRVARVTEYLAPIMATFYVLVVVVIMVMNLSKLPGLFSLIFASAFASKPIVSGLGGGILAALITGTQRGMFSNEAGQGTAPNAAATATVDHPVKQGFVQSLGVFVDTIIVCTATAMVILIAGERVWAAPGVNPSNLTMLAVQNELGNWTVIPMAIMIFVLAFSSIIAAYVYSEVNMDFIISSPVGRWVVRIVSVASVGIGAVASLQLVWNMVDIAMAVMTVMNLLALLYLYKWVVGVLKDYEARKGAAFNPQECEYLPAKLPAEVAQ